MGLYVAFTRTDTLMTGVSEQSMLRSPQTLHPAHRRNRTSAYKKTNFRK